MDCEEAEAWSVEILLGRFRDEGEQKRGDRIWTSVWIRT